VGVVRVRGRACGCRLLRRAQTPITWVRLGKASDHGAASAQQPSQPNWRLELRRHGSGRIPMVSLAYVMDVRDVVSAAGRSRRSSTAVR
jgi:hypothetical protein